MSQEPSPLDQLLERARAEGQLESHGQLTVDARGAQSRLGRAALPDKNFYVLKLVQAAVAGGALKLEIKVVTGQSLEFNWVGETLDAGSLLELESHLLPGGPSRRERSLHHLARALQALRDQSPGHVRLTVNGCFERDVKTTVFGSFELELTNKTPPSRAAYRLEVRHRWQRRIFGDAMSATSTILPWLIGIPLCLVARTAAPLALVRRVSKYQDPEITLLHARALHCPVPIYINGVLQNKVSSAPKANALHYCLLDRFDADHLVPCALKSPARRAFYQRVVGTNPPAYESVTNLPDARESHARLLTSGGDPSLAAFANLYKRPSPAGSKVQFLNDGVIVSTDIKALRGWNGVVSTRGLSTDLSGFNIVRDHAFETRMAFLRERLAWAQGEAQT